MKSPAQYLKDAYHPQSTHLVSWITLQMTIMSIRHLGTTCPACPTTKNIAELKLLSTICIPLQSTDPQQTSASSASSFTSKMNLDMTLQII
uniref:Uncharacterized protein n=1 Tax=Romanomermis culicivorax TaxID=13658 RepID=A0A915L3D0_ROMCU